MSNSISELNDEKKFYVVNLKKFITDIESYTKDCVTAATASINIAFKSSQACNNALLLNSTLTEPIDITNNTLGIITNTDFTKICKAFHLNKHTYITRTIPITTDYQNYLYEKCLLYPYMRNTASTNYVVINIKQFLTEINHSMSNELVKNTSVSRFFINNFGKNFSFDYYRYKFCAKYGVYGEKTKGFGCINYLKFSDICKTLHLNVEEFIIRDFNVSMLNSSEDTKTNTCLAKTADKQATVKNSNSKSSKPVKNNTIIEHMNNDPVVNFGNALSDLIYDAVFRAMRDALNS